MTSLVFASVSFLVIMMSLLIFLLEFEKMEDKFPKSLIVVLWFIAAGLFLNAALPFLGAPAVAQSGVTKVAICDEYGSVCAEIWGNYGTDLGLKTY